MSGLKLYIGKVKDNRDFQRMGRLRVFLPEMGGLETSEDRWYTIRYVSPFAGVTDYRNNVPEGEESFETQISYGWWAVPPDLNNEVLVGFVNGDMSQGVYLGSLYQQYMNHSIPGRASNESFKEGKDGILPPVEEYNRISNLNPPDPLRPRNEELHEALVRQGLYRDFERGPSSASPRRDSVSQVFGLKTPRGHSFYIDEGEIETEDDEQTPVLENNQIKRKEDSVEYMRFRTRNGVQILLNDTTGYIYFITKGGNSWAELNDDGINFYTNGNYNVRAQGSMNVRVDGDYNLEVQGDMNTFVGGNHNTTTSGDRNEYSSGPMSFSTESELSQTAESNYSVKSESSIALNSSGAMYLTGNPIYQNGPPGPAPNTATKATQSALNDRDTSGERVESSSTLSQGSFVTHEPYDNHPATRQGTASSFDPQGGVIPVDCEPTLPQRTGSGDRVNVPGETFTPNADNGLGFLPPVASDPAIPFGVNNPLSPENGIGFEAAIGEDIFAPRGGILENIGVPTTQDLQSLSNRISKGVGSVSQWGESPLDRLFEGSLSSLGTNIMETIKNIDFNQALNFVNQAAQVGSNVNQLVSLAQNTNLGNFPVLLQAGERSLADIGAFFQEPVGPKTRIRHDNGFTSLFSGMDAIRQGRVEQGTVIGQANGNSTWINPDTGEPTPIVNYTLNRNNQPEDPTGFFYNQSSSLPENQSSEQPNTIYFDEEGNIREEFR